MDYIIGGVAGAGATMFTNPFDVVKTRLQLQGELRARGSHAKQYRGVLHGMYVIGSTEGISALQKGLVPAMLFGFVMNSVRLGSYNLAEVNGLTKNKKGEVSLRKAALWGGLSGFVSGWAANPLSVIKTRLQAASHPSIAVGKQHAYTGTLDAIRSIHRQEGLRGWFAGIGAACSRVALGSAAQLSTFSTAKQTLLKYGVCTNSPLGLAFCASALGGVAVSVVICPLDVITSRLYNQGPATEGAPRYKGVFDCLRKIYRIEGIHGFFKGLGPLYLRVGPHTIVSLIIWDGLTSLMLVNKPS